MFSEPEAIKAPDKKHNKFDEAATIKRLRHYLPAQAPLKDFIHHNTLHAFQHENFFKAINNASAIFGYKVSLSLNEYRKHYDSGRITENALERVLRGRMINEMVEHWKTRALYKRYDTSADT